MPVYVSLRLLKPLLIGAAKIRQLAPRLISIAFMWQVENGKLPRSGRLFPSDWLYGSCLLVNTLRQMQALASKSKMLCLLSRKFRLAA
jgi:hypothetical protein